MISACKTNELVPIFKKTVLFQKSCLV